MIEVKDNFIGGLDLDNDLHKVAKNSYVEALNITRVSGTSNQNNSVLNVVGNQVVAYTLPAGRNKVIGAYPCVPRNTIIYMVWNEDDLHTILEYNHTTRVITPIFANLTDSDDVDVLGFTEHEKITSINVYIREEEGDLLFFLDSLNRPTGLDIDLFKAGEYTPVTRDILDVGKRPPLAPPTAIFGNDTTRRSNDFRNKLVRFKYRYVYDDLTKSTTSPVSSIPIPVNILSDTYTNELTNNNVVFVSLNTGDKDVKEIQLLVSYVNKTNDWSDFALVESIDKSSVALRIVSEPFPTSASTDGRVVAFFTSATNLAVGNIVNVYLQPIAGGSPVLVGTYTTVTGDVIDDLIDGLIASMTSIGIVTSPAQSGDSLFFFFDDTLYTYSDTTKSINEDNFDFSYPFYNDGTYAPIDVNESIQLFDYVPDEAEAQDLANGNVLVYGNITEGYDRDLEPNVVVLVLTTPAGSGGTTGGLNATTPENVVAGLTEFFTTTLTGTPAVGTTIVLTLSVSGSPVTASYTTIAGDTANSVAAAWENAIIAAYAFVNVLSPRGDNRVSLSWTNSSASYTSLVVTSSAGSIATSSISTHPFSTSKRLGLVYYDKKGKTNGVLYQTKVTFPAYSENISQEVQLPYINAKIYHTPPIWAHSFHWVITQENTWFIYWYTSAVNSTEPDYLYFNVSNFVSNASRFPTTAEVLSYTFQDGDRVRLIKRDSDNVVFADTYDTGVEGLIVDPKIGGVTVQGTWLKVRKVAPLSTVDFSSQNFIIQIYRPAQQLANSENQVFYEFAQQYYIGDAGLPARYHFGSTTTQDRATGVPAEFNMYNGDAYFHLRTISTSESDVASFNVLDRNMVDKYISAVNDIDGRALIVDEDAKRATYQVMVRFGQAYQANTSINGFNRFYPNNFDEYDLTFGGIKRLRTRDRYLRVFQELKTGTVPIFSEIRKDENGGEIRVVTDKLLNPIQYYVGNFGIGTAPESLASFNFADYFCDNNKGVICRVSNDGVTPLSIIYRVNSMATFKLPLRKGNYKIYGVYEPSRLGNYVIAMEEVPTDDAYTISFTEEVNSFESPLSYHPEMMVSLPTVLVCFKNGALWVHDSETYNNFFGTQYDSSITPVFNENSLDKKQPMGITEVANRVWDCPDIETSTNSYGSTKQRSNLVEEDFEEVESEFVADFLRDSNSQGGLIEGDFLKAKHVKVKFRVANATDLAVLNMLSLKWNNSPLNIR